MIRPITEADKGIYIELANEFFHSDAVSHPIPSRHFEDTFCELMRSKSRVECYLIEHNGMVCGYTLLAKFFSQEAGGEVVWIDELYIREGFRNLGLGSDTLEQIKRKFPNSAFRLEVEADNIGAKELYRKFGFSPLLYEQMFCDKYHNM